MEKLFNKIPLWVINALSLVSAILTIITTFYAMFSIHMVWKTRYKIVLIALILFIVLLIFRIRKYQKILFNRQLITAFAYHKLTHMSRDLYFDVMRSHKDKIENINNLTNSYQPNLSTILTYLCEMMENYCGQKVSSCIKLIIKPEEKIENIKLMTFCRSNNSDTTRGIYEKTNDIINLKDNTDFLYIVDTSNDSNLDYFYQGNLEEFEKEYRKQGKVYKNSNPNWKDDYIGTIVVPIQINHKHLYDTQSENSFHIIGFLCIDSKSSSAFLERQEKFNVNMLKSFADIIYILLSQYQHYLKKIANKP